MSYPFWIEFRTGAAVVARRAAAMAAALALVAGFVWLYTAVDVARLIINWAMGGAVVLVLLLIVVAGVCAAGEAELDRRRRDAVDEDDPDYGESM